MLFAFLALALLAAGLGGVSPLAQTFLSRPRLRRLVDFRSGILVAVTFLDLLPEAWKYHPTAAGSGALASFLLFYAMQNFSMVDPGAEYLESGREHRLGWAALTGLFIRSFMDGFNLAVSFAATGAAGAAVGAAMILQKATDGFALTSLFQQAGASRRRRLLGLAAVAAAAPLGCAASSLSLADFSPRLTATLLGVAGGSLLYLGAADLGSRLHKGGDSPAFESFVAGAAAFWLLHSFSH